MLAVSLWLSSLRFCYFGEHVYFLLVSQRTVFVVCDSEPCPVPLAPPSSWRLEDEVRSCVGSATQIHSSD